MKIINIVSGKGGTGKTLFSATLAHILGDSRQKVLVIDIDIFVRGLTTLLYHKDNSSLQMIEKNKISVSEFIERCMKLNSNLNSIKNLNISTTRYQNFDIAPAVNHVTEIIEYKNIMPDSFEQCHTILNKIVENVENNGYDIIIFDSRAGYDEMILATHMVSDFSICVEEDDPVSRVTSDNLIQQLSHNSKKQCLRLINKSRNTKNTNETLKHDLRFIGEIPFDMDVMDLFGTTIFWRKLPETLYYQNVIESWNRLSAKMNIKLYLNKSRISPMFSKVIEKKFGLFSSFKRILILYSLIVGLSMLFMGIIGLDSISEYFTNIEPTSIFFLSSGLILLFVTLYLALSQNKRPK